MNYVGLGRKIRIARKEQDMTQTELADKAQISPSFLGHIERGARKMSVETLINIVNALRVPIDHLLQDSLDLVLPDKRNEQEELVREIKALIDRYNF